jgi:hypothetical protein
MSNASLLVSILSEVHAACGDHTKLPRYNPTLPQSQLCQEVAYRQGIRDALNALQEACEKAQGHALEHVPVDTTETEEEPARLSADQALMKDV